jgi:hypothetical protein
LETGRPGGRGFAAQIADKVESLASGPEGRDHFAGFMYGLKPVPFKNRDFIVVFVMLSTVLLTSIGRKNLKNISKHH